MSSIGNRLREERERLGLNQTAFGAIGGVQKQAQLKYEKGERFPDAGYLSEIVKVGADVQYIITGSYTSTALTDDENQLVTLFRAAPLPVKAATIAGLAAGGAPLTGSVMNTNSGDGAQQNFVHSTVGSVTTGDVILGRGKKKT
ncbi:helix-turn-helix domain-containing protein [Aeromonas veronii]